MYPNYDRVCISPADATEATPPMALSAKLVAISPSYGSRAPMSTGGRGRAPVVGEPMPRGTREPPPPWGGVLVVSNHRTSTIPQAACIRGAEISDPLFAPAVTAPSRWSSGTTPWALDKRDETVTAELTNGLQPSVARMQGACGILHIR